MAELFLGGQPVTGGGERMPVRDPATGGVVDTVPAATDDDVDRAVQAARTAASGWAARPAAERGDVLYAAVAAVEARIDELAPLLTAEQGKPVREARLELHRFAETLRHYAGLSRNLRGGYVPDLDTGAHGLIVRKPLGVVAAIVPWNFPTTLLGNKLGPALVAGNTLVAKPADTTPLTTLRIAAVLADAGVPPGVFNVVTGTGPGAGEALVRHPAVRKVGFTGSTATGRRVAELAAADLTHLTLELGGSDPFIVCDDADLDAAVSAASMGRFFNCGQACLAVKRLFVFDGVLDEVVDRLVKKVDRLRVGPGTADGVQLGPLHTAAQRELVEAQLADGVGSGGEVLIGGQRPDPGAGDHPDGPAAGDGDGWFLEPTLVAEPAPDSRLAREEVFGPVLPIWGVSGLDEAIERANDTVYGLGSSVWTGSVARANQAVDRLEAGYTWVNRPSRVYDELPFGGVKQSGIGREHGIEALDHYLQTQSVVMGHDG